MVVQWTQPLAASRAYTLPSWLPAKTLPRYTAGCERSVEVSGKANAHFKTRRGTESAARPASFAGRKRVFASPPPQLLQLGVFFQGALAGQGFAISSRLFSTVTAVPRKL